MTFSTASIAPYIPITPNINYNRLKDQTKPVIIQRSKERGRLILHPQEIVLIKAEQRLNSSKSSDSKKVKVVEEHSYFRTLAGRLRDNAPKVFEKISLSTIPLKRIDLISMISREVLLYQGICPIKIPEHLESPYNHPPLENFLVSTESVVMKNHTIKYHVISETEKGSFNKTLRIKNPRKVKDILDKYEFETIRD